jgi:hypothetical protein
VGSPLSGFFFHRLVLHRQPREQLGLLDTQAIEQPWRA